MEFRCSECGHIGPADEVRPASAGLEVVCAECGAAEALDVGGDGAEERDAFSEPIESGDGRDGDSLETFDARTTGSSSRERDEALRVSKEKALERLIPNEGDGARCPKCAKLLAAHITHCPRCGLDVEEARTYDPGEEPWEDPPQGREGAYEQAELLWSAFTEDDDPDKLARFVHFVEEEGFYEMAIRRLRFFLIDQRDHEEALEALQQLAVGVQSRLASAQAQAEVNAEELNKDIRNFKRKLIWGVLIVWGLALVFFIQLFW